jgi:hypothetical protein
MEHQLTPFCDAMANRLSPTGYHIRAFFSKKVGSKVRERNGQKCITRLVLISACGSRDIRK